MTLDDAFTPVARDDIDGQAFWLSKRSQELAWRFLESVERTAEAIICNPDSGMIWDGDDSGGHQHVIRYRIVDRFTNHLLIYSVKPDGVRILRLLHGARRITSSMILDN